MKDKTGGFFAIPFGTGRHLLRPGSYVWNYGLRVALNLLYEKGGGAEEASGKIRSIDAKTVAATTLRTRRQASRSTDFETFDVDIDRDMLKSVTGRPSDTGIWGTRVTGADALQVAVRTDFAELGSLCGRIEETFRKRDYKERFSWIDKIRTVKDPDLVARLRDAVIGKLRAKDVEHLELAPPELVDWDAIESFQHSVSPGTAHVDLELSDYLAALGAKEQLAELSFEDIRGRHRIKVLDSGGATVFDWPVLRCIAGEVRLEGTTYLVDGPDFFEVAETYMAELNRYIAGIDESNLILPPSAKEMAEGDYNTAAADSSDGYLLLDKKMVTLTTHTTPIEICDILTKDRAFIHVKRKLGSADLSHLFAQGVVSADLFLMSREYRERALETIRSAENERARSERDPAFRGRFSTYSVDGISASDYEVIYAIIAAWDDRAPSAALPFFSKVNLRRQVRDLRRMGYGVAIKSVSIQHRRSNLRGRGP